MANSSNMVYGAKIINSLWPSNTIRQQGTESTLAQVMACCLTAPSHHLNQSWLIISEVLWHSLEGIIMRRSGLLPDGTKPSPEPILTYHQWGPVAFIGGHYHEKIWLVAWRHQAITWTNLDLSSVRSCGIHRRALSWEDLACCLTAPSHHLNQSWLIISEVLWHSSEGIIMRRSEDTNQ